MTDDVTAIVSRLKQLIEYQKKELANTIHKDILLNKQREQLEEKAQQLNDKEKELELKEQRLNKLARRLEVNEALNGISKS